MKTARWLAAAGGLLGLLPWLPATAQPAEQGKLFSRLDHDGNGYLDEAEMQAAAQPRLRGYSAQRLIGSEVRYRNGAALGEVHDILVNPRGKVAALLIETRAAGVQHVPRPSRA